MIEEKDVQNYLNRVLVNLIIQVEENEERNKNN